MKTKKILKMEYVLRHKNLFKNYNGIALLKKCRQFNNELSDGLTIPFHKQNIMCFNGKKYILSRVTPLKILINN